MNAPFEVTGIDHVVFHVKDLARSRKFYTEVLGFECVAEQIDEDGGWAKLTRDDAAIMLSSPNQHEEDKAPAFTGSLYMNTDDVDAIWETVKDKARICYRIEDFEYGMREFGIYDNNGYLLQFGQEI